jgi:type I restriction enzyme S subunit
MGVRLIRISNVGVGTLMAKDDKYLPPTYLRDKSEYALEEGDLILALTRPIIAEGIKFCFVRKLDIPALLNQRVGKFQITSPKLLKDYLSHVLFSDYFIKPLRTMAEGSNQPNISPTRLENFLIPIPTDLKEQAEIAEALTSITKKAETAQRKHAALTALFRTLLHQLMTAQIRVGDLSPDNL